MQSHTQKAVSLCPCKQCLLPLTTNSPNCSLLISSMLTHRLVILYQKDHGILNSQYISTLINFYTLLIHRINTVIIHVIFRSKQILTNNLTFLRNIEKFYFTAFKYRYIDDCISDASINFKKEQYQIPSLSKTKDLLL